MEDVERVKIWNTFFMLAREEAQKLKYIQKRKPFTKYYGKVPKGGVLPKKKFYTLSTLLFSYMAIEARINHLIDEMVEKGKISPKSSQAIKKRSTIEKWYLLPKYINQSCKLKSKEFPHKAINEICEKRNNLIHVNYDKLYEQLSSLEIDETLMLFKEFVNAMENMNVKLPRDIPKERKEVLKIGELKDC